MKSTGVSKLINLCEYPINQPGKRLSLVINKVRDDLNKDGCAIIRRFLSEKGISELVKEAENDSKIVAVTAAMPSGTGLDKFYKMFPSRFLYNASASTLIDSIIEKKS